MTFFSIPYRESMASAPSLALEASQRFYVNVCRTHFATLFPSELGLWVQLS